MENEVKEPAPKYNFITQEAYLEMERASEVKHEYYKGEVFAMSGASVTHNEIAYNLNSIIIPHLKNKNCKMYRSDLRIHIPSNSLYTYPDFSIICGKPETTDVFADNVTNPSVLIEILSKSTKDYDRGTKFNLYRSIQALKEYIIISSLSVQVEKYNRLDDDSWNLKEFNKLTDNFYISAIGLTVILKDIYQDISFSE